MSEHTQAHVCEHTHTHCSKSSKLLTTFCCIRYTAGEGRGKCVNPWWRFQKSISPDSHTGVLDSPNTNTQYPPTFSSLHLSNLNYVSPLCSPKHQCPKKLPSPSTSSLTLIFWAINSVVTPLCWKSSLFVHLLFCPRLNLYQVRNLHQGFTHLPLPSPAV